MKCRITSTVRDQYVLCEMLSDDGQRQTALIPIDAYVRSGLPQKIGTAFEWHPKTRTVTKCAEPA